MGYTRRQFIAGTAAAASASAPAQRRPPNILVFMSDQESALLPGPVKLPHRDRLLERGVEFTHAFCNTPQCSAARAALLTGLDPHRAGVLTNVDASSLGKPLSPSLPNVGSVFQNASYNTGYFGKWHLGNDSEGLKRFGFTHSIAGRGGDEEAAGNAASWIREQNGPWLAWVSLLDPHDIYRAPKILPKIRPRAGVKPPSAGLANLARKPSEQREYVENDQGRAARDFSPEDWIRYRSYYLELVEKVDSYLGTVLDSAGELDSTIVIYTSDHGDALGEHGLPFKGPFQYEELIRIPFIVSAPGLRKRKSGSLITQTDLAPTLAALAGIRWPDKTNGADILRDGFNRDAVFLEYYAKQKWINPIRTIRTGEWKFNCYDSGNKELYNLNADPHEETNRAGETEVVSIQSQLQARLDTWRAPLTKPAREPRA